MKEIILLIRVMLKNGLRVNNKNKKSGQIAIYVALAISYLCIIGPVTAGMVFVAPFAAQNGIIQDLTMMIYFGILSIVVIFGIISMFSYLYLNKDAQFLAALPISPSKVFFAKIIIVYLYELFFVAAIGLPLMLAIAISAKMGVMYYVSIVLSLVVVPFFPLLIASILSFPLMYIISYLKKKGTMTTLVMVFLYVFFFVIYIVGYLSYQNAMLNIGDASDALLLQSMLNPIKAFANAIKYPLYPLYALACFGSNLPLFGLNKVLGAIVNLSISVGGLGVIMAISYLISGTIYQKASTLQFENAKDTNKKIEFKQNNILKALIYKEHKETVRAHSFGFQALAGIVMCPLMVVFFYLIYSKIPSVAERGVNLGDGVVKAMCVMAITMMGCGMNTVSSTAISREGKNFYIAKFIPVDYTTQVKAKLYYSLIINYIGVGLAYLTCVIINKMSFVEILLLPPFFILYSYAFATISLRFDLKSPKLDWTDPREAMKNNKNANVTTLVNMAISFVLFIVNMLLYMAGDFVVSMGYKNMDLLIIGGGYLLLAAIAGLLAFLGQKNLYKKVDTILNEIEA